MYFFFFQAEDGIRDPLVTGVQTCALPIFVTVCDYNHEFLTQRLARARVVRIYNGVDLDQWRRARSRPAGPSILAVGRLVPKKGFHVLIEAMAILKEWDVPALATIVGEGVEREHLARAIRAHRLGRR